LSLREAYIFSDSSAAGREESSGDGLAVNAYSGATGFRAMRRRRLMLKDRQLLHVLFED
jgi:hypothetical protein